jgi:hypothetical protein
MGRADYLKLGDYNAYCSMCGFKRKAGELVRNWQGMYRCPEHNEVRHPQDFVRAVPDVQTPPWTQRLGDPTYSDPTWDFDVSSADETVTFANNSTVVVNVHEDVTITTLRIDATGTGSGATILVNIWGRVTTLYTNTDNFATTTTQVWPGGYLGTVLLSNSGIVGIGLVGSMIVGGP